MEGDKIQHRPAGAGRNFYPRPPGGGRQQGLAGFRWGRRISIHALRVEGDSKAPEFCIRIIISIHALRVEGDRFCYAGGWRKDISIHALRVEGDISSGCHPLRGSDFYPRPPDGGRRQRHGNTHFYTHISIHALRVEDDCTRLLTRWQKNKFLSTPSGWRATPRHHAP